jgi:hypothetical protein
VKLGGAFGPGGAGGGGGGAGGLFPPPPHAAATAASAAIRPARTALVIPTLHTLN